MWNFIYIMVCPRFWKSLLDNDSNSLTYFQTLKQHSPFCSCCHSERMDHFLQLNKGEAIRQGIFFSKFENKAQSRLKHMYEQVSRHSSLQFWLFPSNHYQRLYTLLCTTWVNIFKAISFLVLILETSDPKVWWWNPVIPTNWEECGEAVENDWQPSPLKGLLLCWWSSHPQILWHSLVSTYSWGFLGQQKQPGEAEGCNVLHVGKNPTMIVYSSVKQWLLQLRVKQRLT